VMMSYGLAPGKFEHLECEVSILAARQTECNASVKDISSSLEKEIADRCSLNSLIDSEVSSLRAHIASSISERAAANQADLCAQREEIMRALQAEHDGRVQDTGDIRASIEDLKSELPRNLQTERSSRSHDGVLMQQEISRALDDERGARIQQIREVHCELANAISKEREDRICENSDQSHSHARSLDESLSNLRTELQERITDLRSETRRLREEQSRAVLANTTNINDLLKNVQDLEEQQRQHAEVLDGLQHLETTLVQRIEILQSEQRQEIMSYGLAPGKFENLEREVSVLVAGQTECNASVKDIS